MSLSSNDKAGLKSMGAGASIAGALIWAPICPLASIACLVGGSVFAGEAIKDGKAAHREEKEKKERNKLPMSFTKTYYDKYKHDEICDLINNRSSFFTPPAPESVLAKYAPDRAERVLMAQTHADIANTWLTHRLPDEKDIDISTFKLGPFTKTKVRIR